MSFPIFFDTNALFGATLCDLTLRLAEEGAFRPLWSEQVLQELERNLPRRISVEAAQARVAYMRTAFPEAAVTGFEGLVSAMTCDEKDRHVLAAAVRADAEVLVTFDVRDFPAQSVQPFELVVRTPDDFLLDQLGLHPALCLRAIYAISDTYERPPLSPQEVASALSSTVPAFARAVRPLL